MKKSLVNEVRQLQKIAGILKETRNVEQGLENIFLSSNYINFLRELIEETPEGETKSALLVYIAALEDAWRHFDDDVDVKNPDYDDIWHNLEYANAEVGGKIVSYKEAEEMLKSLDADLQDEVWELFMDGKQDYYG